MGRQHYSGGKVRHWDNSEDAGKGKDRVGNYTAPGGQSQQADDF